MAKMFYTLEEACDRVGKSEEELKEMVRAGTLREFRDGGAVHYRVEDVDALAGRDQPELSGVVNPRSGGVACPEVNSENRWIAHGLQKSLWGSLSPCRLCIETATLELIQHQEARGGGIIDPTSPAARSGA